MPGLGLLDRFEETCFEDCEVLERDLAFAQLERLPLFRCNLANAVRRDSGDEGSVLGGEGAEWISFVECMVNGEESWKAV